MPRIIVFDVNETLLDLSALDHHFERLFGDAAVRKQWFGQVLRSSLVATITDTYHDFGVIAGDALAMMAMIHRVTLSEDDRATVIKGVRSLPAHEDIPDSLEKLQAAGLRMIALTNSPPHVLKDQLTNSGLIGYFEQTLSVDATRKFKPAKEVYLHAANSLGVDPGQLRMVAAHDWDIAGAMRAGLAGAFVARPGMVIGPLQEPPDIIGSDMREVVAQILEKEGVG
ncbi:MAG: haloacid dehalogenase type II [Anaerolineae bacterium]|nr:haloacid dehalogenase type II [Anaerolineae bacterium]